MNCIFDIFKSPKTDPTKNSKKGQLKLVKNELGEFKTVNKHSQGIDLLIPVFDNGHMLKEWTLEEVRSH